LKNCSSDHKLKLLETILIAWVENMHNFRQKKNEWNEINFGVVSCPYVYHHFFNGNSGWFGQNNNANPSSVYFFKSTVCKFIDIRPLYREKQNHNKYKWMNRSLTKKKLMNFVSFNKRKIFYNILNFIIPSNM
jgi:hypothetical protein